MFTINCSPSNRTFAFSVTYTRDNQYHTLINKQTKRKCFSTAQSQEICGSAFMLLTVIRMESNGVKLGLIYWTNKLWSFIVCSWNIFTAQTSICYILENIKPDGIPCIKLNALLPSKVVSSILPPPPLQTPKVHQFLLTNLLAALIFFILLLQLEFMHLAKLQVCTPLIK